MINWLKQILSKVLTMKADYDKMKAERVEAEILIKEIMDACEITPD